MKIIPFNSGDHLVPLYPTFCVTCVPVSLIMSSCKALWNAVRGSGCSFYRLPDEARVPPMASFYLSLQILAHQSKWCSTHFPPRSSPSLLLSSVTLIRFPLLARAPHFNSTPRKNMPTTSANKLAGILSLSPSPLFSFFIPTVPPSSISSSPPHYHVPSYSDEFQIERGTLLISSVKMLCRGQCGHQCVHWERMCDS